MLTRRERDLYDFIAAYIEEHGKAPSQPEMAEGLNCKQGYNTQRLVDGLEDKGYIYRERFKHRTIIITRYADGRKVPYKMCGGTAFPAEYSFACEDWERFKEIKELLARAMLLVDDCAHVDSGDLADNITCAAADVVTAIETADEETGRHE